MPLIDRKAFLKVLEMVQPGISSRGVLDQSDCFILLDGGVHTFSGEVACYHAAGLPGVTGAVKASPLLAQLGKWTEDEVEVEVEGTAEGSRLWFYGARRKAWLNMETTIQLPVHTIARPVESDWKDLPANFSEAVSIVQSCAGTDINKPQLTCVHLHPDCLEASDNVQVGRYVIKTEGMQKTLVRATAIRSIVGLGMVQYSQTESWVHFRNQAGLVLSCQRYLEDFPDVSDALKVEGTKTHFPKTLQESVALAEIFTKEKTDENQVRISLTKGRVRVRGVGKTGGFSEVKDAEYDGPEISFLIAPKMLSEIIRNHNEVFISPGKMVADGGCWVYRTCTGIVEES